MLAAAAAAASMGATAAPGRHALAELVDGEERLCSTSSSNPFFPTTHGFRRNQIGHGKKGRDLVVQDEVAGMEEIQSHFSSDAIYYTEYENSQDRCEHELAVAKYNRKKMKVKTRSIKNRLVLAKYKNKKNAMGWLFLTRYMHGFSDHISNVTTLNKLSGKEPIDQLINGPPNSIEKVAERLKRRVISSEKKL